ncbi:MAG TPA: serine/threonine-protein kinase [Ktedonobacterales bacterium]|nr:serine/threonine-protein kinase [Ktedonobacterales bacterium]
MGERDADPTRDAAPGGLTGSTLGGFELISLLGAGGMAEVYRGYDRSLHREVAVKVLPRGVARDPEYVARFRSEAQAVAALNHPNIVPIFHFGEERGLLYLVMPVLKESLRERMIREGVLDPVEAVALCVEVADALDATHRQGLAHRDVKPENILLNDEGRPLLSDFGIAREVEALRDASAVRTLSGSGLPVGTPEYMAPEQLRGAVADQRVDVYGLGAVLYELLTGHVPHEGLTPYDVAARALTEAPRSPAEYNPALWTSLADVVLGAVASDPNLRYPDMSSMAEALRRAMVARGSSTYMSERASLIDAPRRPAQPRMVPAGDTQWDRWGLSGLTAGIARRRSVATRNLRQRRLQWLVAVVSGILALAVLALGAFGAGRVLFASQASATGPTTSTTSTTPISTLPIAATTPTVAPTATPTPTRAPAPGPTATPLRTPTMVASASPLRFQPYPPAPQTPTNCVATQKLTNISAVDARWSWSNAPAASGWQYNTAGLSSKWQAFPAPLTMTTPPNSSVYVYIKTGYDKTYGCAKLSTVATITVASGSGARFSVSY